MILFGDGIHNFLDGILIAAAFLTDVNLGIVTSLAVAAHEIPQGSGRFCCTAAIRAPGRSIITSWPVWATVLGGVLAYFGLGGLHGALPYLLALAAASFIYIAVADLIPTLHKKTDAKAARFSK